MFLIVVFFCDDLYKYGWLVGFVNDRVLKKVLFVSLWFFEYLLFGSNVCELF